MSIQTKSDLRKDIVFWLQNTYGGKKFPAIFYLRNQWLVCSYFKGRHTLVLGLAQGPVEARITKERGRMIKIDVSECKSLAEFKLKFRALLQYECKEPENLKTK